MAKLVPFGFGAALLLASAVASGPSPAAQGDCSGFTWPDYPAECLAREDGRATQQAARTATANPPAAAPELAPLPVIDAYPRGGAIPPIEERHEEFDRLQELPASAPTAAITVWRGTEPTIYIVSRD